MIFYQILDVNNINWETLPEFLTAEETAFIFEHKNKYAVKNALNNHLAGRLSLILLFQKTHNGKSIISAKIQENEYGKPYFEEGPFFNISHSGQSVIATLSPEVEVGVDIERIKTINYHDFEEYFTLREWASIENSINKELTFLKLWTRKEALMKGDGRGFSIPPQDLEIRDHEGWITNDKKRWYFYDLKSPEGYIASLCATVPGKKLINVPFKGLTKKS